MTPLAEGIEACAAVIPPSSATAAVAPTNAFDFVAIFPDVNLEPLDMLAYAFLPNEWATRMSQADAQNVRRQIRARLPFGARRRELG
jgi:hypothetical protein